MYESKPWINEDGSLKTEDEIKLLCKEWPPSVWEEFLSTLEVEQEELLFDEAVDVESYSETEHDRYYRNVFDRGSLPSFKDQLISVIKTLTHKQQKVLYQFYWEDKNLREIGELNGTCTSSVAELRDKALKKIAVALVEKIVPLTVMSFKAGNETENKHEIVCMDKEA